MLLAVLTIVHARDVNGAMMQYLKRCLLRTLPFVGLLEWTFFLFLGWSELRRACSYTLGQFLTRGCSVCSQALICSCYLSDLLLFCSTLFIVRQRMSDCEVIEISSDTDSSRLSATPLALKTSLMFLDHQIEHNPRCLLPLRDRHLHSLPGLPSLSKILHYWLMVEYEADQFGWFYLW